MNPLQQAAVRRKVAYFAAILALFTISMFWRGTIPIPLAGRAKAADWVASRTLLDQSQRLELRELEQGDPELAGETVRLLLTGSRGLAVTFLWQQAIDKQKRNDFHEFEVLVKQVTMLQPHFITPWIFQSWNIAYNVSVEQDKLNDMYFYIARGIELLAEGERRNKRSPDMRYQIAFYYQNKFGVSDKVQTLRCLYELSCMPPGDRNTAPGNLTNADGSVNTEAFKRFCEKYPHLVRRLRDKLNCKRPSDVIDFLRENRTVPTRYKNATDLAEAERQFPSLPPRFSETEAHPGSETRDDFTGYKAARAWFAYANQLVPPPDKDEQGRPLPGPTPRPGTEGKFGEYDPMKYRVPRLPMLIIFRQGPPRAQSFQAELEEKEGWFDDDGWRPDEGADETNAWFTKEVTEPDGRKVRQVETGPDGKPLVFGAGRAWALQEWRAAAQLWRKHGEDYALSLPPDRLARLQADSKLTPQVVGAAEDDPLVQRVVRARQALQFYDQNRSVTNFPYFLAAAEAEEKPDTVIARKILWQADQARKSVRGKLEAVKLYKEGLKAWKQVLAANPAFHRGERSDRTEEETFEYELEYLRLAGDDPEVVARAKVEYEQALLAVVPFLPGHPDLPAAGREDLYASVAEAYFSPFAKPMDNGDPWINPAVKETVRNRQGGLVKPNEQQPANPAPTPGADQPQPGGPVPGPKQ